MANFTINGYHPHIGNKEKRILQRLKKKCENCQFYSVHSWRRKLMPWGICILTIGADELDFGTLTLNFCTCKRYQQREGPPFISYGRNTIGRGNIRLIIKTKERNNDD